MRLSASVVMVASPGLLAPPTDGEGGGVSGSGGGNQMARAAVSEAVMLGIPVYILAPPAMMGAGVDSLLGGQGGGKGSPLKTGPTGGASAGGDDEGGPLTEMVCSLDPLWGKSFPWRLASDNLTSHSDSISSSCLPDPSGPVLAYLRLGVPHPASSRGDGSSCNFKLRCVPAAALHAGRAAGPA